MPSSANPPLALLPLPAAAIAVAGLLWRPLPLKNSKRTAQQLLKNSGSEHLVVHRRDNQVQCGLAPPLPSGPPYYSAALLLRAALGDDWVGIFEWPPGQYLLFGVSAGQIVPGCDGLFESAAEVTAQFERYQVLCEWPTRYAPAHLNLGGEPLDITMLLNSSLPALEYRLQATYNTPKNRQRLLLVGGLFLGLLTLGYLGCLYHEKQQMMLRLAQQQLLQKQQQYTQQYKQHKQQQVEAVWRQQPAPRVVLQQCVQRLSQYPLLLGGWQLIEGECTSQKSSAVYQRVVPNRVQDFVRAATARYPNGYQLRNAEQAQVQQQLLQLPARGAEQLLPLSTLFNGLMNYRERESARVHMDDDLATASAKKSTHFKLSCQQSPLQLLHAAELSGVVIQRVHSTLSADGSLHWSIHGTLYGE